MKIILDKLQIENINTKITMIYFDWIYNFYSEINKNKFLLYFKKSVMI